MTKEKFIFCGESFAAFRNRFRSVYGYVSLSVCLFGLLNNVINASILRRKSMRSSTNTILIAMAVSDCLVMAEYVPYTVHEYVLHHDDVAEKYTYPWAHFVMFHATFGQIFHTISIWITVTLAAWRWLYIRFPSKNKSWCSQTRALAAIGAVYLLSPFLCLPIFLSLHIEPHYTSGNASVYIVSGMSDNELMKSVHFWIYGVLVKLVPCAILTVIVVCLIHTVYLAKKRRESLVCPCSEVSESSSAGGTRRKHVVVHHHQSRDATNVMLFSVLSLFLITEVPQGILSLVSAFLEDTFYRECVRPFDEIVDILALVNTAINVLLYCSMSSQYRKEFKKAFCCAWRM